MGRKNMAKKRGSKRCKMNTVRRRRPVKEMIKKCSKSMTKKRRRMRKSRRLGTKKIKILGREKMEGMKRIPKMRIWRWRKLLLPLLCKI